MCKLGEWCHISPLSGNSSKEKDELEFLLKQDSFYCLPLSWLFFSETKSETVAKYRVYRTAKVTEMARDSSLDWHWGLLEMARSCVNCVCTIEPSQNHKCLVSVATTWRFFDKGSNRESLSWTSETELECNLFRNLGPNPVSLIPSGMCVPPAKVLQMAYKASSWQCTSNYCLRWAWAN